MNEKSQIRRRRLKFAYFASTGAAVLVLLGWVCSYFVGVMIFGSVQSATPSAGSTTGHVSSNMPSVAVSTTTLMAGGLLLSESVQAAPPSLPRIAFIPVGKALSGRTGAAYWSKALVPQKSPLGTGVWIPLWVPLVACIIPAFVCRKKLNDVRTRRVRRIAVSSAWRLAAVTGAFMIALVLSIFTLEWVLAVILGTRDIVSRIQREWGIGEEGALLVLICTAVAMATACACVVGYILTWRRARVGACARCDYDLRENLSGICPECGHGIDFEHSHQTGRKNEKAGRGPAQIAARSIE